MRPRLPAPADDKFRSRFLWGRKPMLAACAAWLADRSNLVWVDLGGGTGVSSPSICLVGACIAGIGTRFAPREPRRADQARVRQGCAARSTTRRPAVAQCACGGRCGCQSARAGRQLEPSCQLRGRRSALTAVFPRGRPGEPRRLHDHPDAIDHLLKNPCTGRRRPTWR